MFSLSCFISAFAICADKAIVVLEVMIGNILARLGEDRPLG